MTQHRLRKFNDENKELAQNLKRDMEALMARSQPKSVASKKKKALESDLSSTRDSEERQASFPATGRGQKRGRDQEIEKVCDTPPAQQSPPSHNAPASKRLRISKRNPLPMEFPALVNTLEKEPQDRDKPFNDEFWNEEARSLGLKFGEPYLSRPEDATRHRMDPYAGRSTVPTSNEKSFSFRQAAFTNALGKELGECRNSSRDINHELWKKEANLLEMGSDSTSSSSKADRLARTSIGDLPFDTSKYYVKIPDQDKMTPGQLVRLQLKYPSDATSNLFQYSSLRSTLPPKEPEDVETRAGDKKKSSRPNPSSQSGGRMTTTTPRSNNLISSPENLRAGDDSVGDAKNEGKFCTENRMDGAKNSNKDHRSPEGRLGGEEIAPEKELGAGGRISRESSLSSLSSISSKEATNAPGIEPIPEANKSPESHDSFLSATPSIKTLSSDLANIKPVKKAARVHKEKLQNEQPHSEQMQEGPTGRRGRSKRMFVEDIGIGEEKSGEKRRRSGSSDIDEPKYPRSIEAMYSRKAKQIGEGAHAPYKYSKPKMHPQTYQTMLHDAGNQAKLHFFAEIEPDHIGMIAGIPLENPPPDLAPSAKSNRKHFKRNGKKKTTNEPALEQEEAFHARPAVNIPISDHLKSILVDDWENVTKNLSLVPLPSKTPVNAILDTYSNEEKHKRRSGSAEADLLEEVVAGCKSYFSKALGKILLYRFEREQYFQMRKLYVEGIGDWEGKDAGDVYGAEHLARLLGTYSLQILLSSRLQLQFYCLFSSPVSRPFGQVLSSLFTFALFHGPHHCPPRLPLFQSAVPPSPLISFPQSVSLPELIAQTNMDAQSITKLKEEMTKMTSWLSKKTSQYFNTEYEPATQEYIEKARGL